MVQALRIHQLRPRRNTRSFADGMKPPLKLVLFLGVAALIVIGLFWLRARNANRTAQLQDYENSSTAVVVLSKGSSPFLVEVRVIDRDGNPVAGANIDVRNNSGGNAGTTGANGHTSIKVGEREIEQILLGGQPVLNRPSAYALGYPSVEKGLHVLIVKKD